MARTTCNRPFAATTAKCVSSASSERRASAANGSAASSADTAGSTAEATKMTRVSAWIVPRSRLAAYRATFDGVSSSAQKSVPRCTDGLRRAASVSHEESAHRAPEFGDCPSQASYDPTAKSVTQAQVGFSSAHGLSSAYGA